MKRAWIHVRYWMAAWAAVAGLAAAEHRGQVRFGGLPVPGATVTATQNDKRLGAITDQQGAYAFTALPDGVWTIQVDMLCFSAVKQEVAVGPDAPSPVWELKLLPFDEIQASAPPPPAAPGPATAPAGQQMVTQTTEAPRAKPAKPGKKAQSRSAGAGR